MRYTPNNRRKYYCDEERISCCFRRLAGDLEQVPDLTFKRRWKNSRVRSPGRPFFFDRTRYKELDFQRGSLVIIRRTAENGI